MFWARYHEDEFIFREDWEYLESGELMRLGEELLRAESCATFVPILACPTGVVHTAAGQMFLSVSPSITYLSVCYQWYTEKTPFQLNRRSLQTGSRDKLMSYPTVSLL